MTETGEKNFVAGGVALNCVANGVLVKEGYLTTYGFGQQQVTQVGAGLFLHLASAPQQSSKSKPSDSMQGHFSGRHLKMKRLKMSCMPATQICISIR